VGQAARAMDRSDVAAEPGRTTGPPLFSVARGSRLVDWRPAAWARARSAASAAGQREQRPIEPVSLSRSGALSGNITRAVNDASSRVGVVVASRASVGLLREAWEEGTRLICSATTNRIDTPINTTRASGRPRKDFDASSARSANDGCASPRGVRRRRVTRPSCAVTASAWPVATATARRHSSRARRPLRRSSAAAPAECSAAHARAADHATRRRRARPSASAGEGVRSAHHERTAVTARCARCPARARLSAQPRASTPNRAIDAVQAIRDRLPLRVSSSARATVRSTDHEPTAHAARRALRPAPASPSAAPCAR
jgi:hypothetical protein